MPNRPHTVQIELTKSELQDLLKVQFASYVPSDQMSYPAYLAMTSKLMDALKLFQQKSDPEAANK